jgi:uncharacterized protein YkwD
MERSETAASRAAEARLAAAARVAALESCQCSLQDDPDLALAAREHSEILAAGVSPETHGFLRQALSSRGVLDPFPYVFHGSGPPERLDEMEMGLRQHLRDIPEAEMRLYTHVGVGIQARRTRHFWKHQVQWFVTVLLTQRAVAFSPLPTDPRPQERFLFEGEVFPPFRDPRVLLTHPDGNTDVLDNFSNDPRRFRSYVRFGSASGEYQLEVMGRYDMGPRVLGLATLHVGSENGPNQYEVLLAAARNGTLKPISRRSNRSGPRNAQEAERLLLELVNRDRRLAGVPVLLEMPELSRMAREHSKEMRDRHFFAHVSPVTGRLIDRAQSAGIPFRRIGENIAVGDDVQEAQHALMRSPGHRMNLLDPEFTRIGIGIAFAAKDDGQLRVYVTQNFLVPAR